MSDHTKWLPPLVLLEDYGGDWDPYCDALYGFFRQDFVDSRPRFGARRVGIMKEPAFEGKEATFWHIISEGRAEDERLPDFRRCERIRWPRPLVEAAAASKIRWWTNRRDKQRRIVIAVDDFSYVVVLLDRKRYMLLVTAYCVEREHRRRKLRLECEGYRRGAQMTDAAP